MYFVGFLPGLESNPGCWDSIPDDHLDFLMVTTFAEDLSFMGSNPRRNFRQSLIPDCQKSN